jgi:ProP effector
MSDTTRPASPAHNARALLKQLQQDYKVIGEHQPLAIGIDRQLLAARPDIDRKAMRIALGMHTRAVSYLKVLQSAQTRFNLDGSPAGEVSEEQRSLAAKTLHEHFKKRALEHKTRAATEAAERQHAEKLRQLQDKFSKK